MNFCACGSQRDYKDCCGLFLSNQAQAPTPETLMRSRYTAYTQANIDYIKKTMRGPALLGFNEIEATNWARKVQWLGLKVLNSYLDSKDSKKGFVEFIATFKDGNNIDRIHELSEFQYLEGCWYYTTGELPQNRQKPKISRNAPCPCGSQKKFKNCCLKSGAGLVSQND